MSEDEVPTPDGVSDEPTPPGLDMDYIQQPIPGGEPVEVAERSPITGGEGFGVVRRRHLLVLMPLPVYLKDKEHPERGIDFILQAQMLDYDIREAMVKAARKLNDTAMKYTVTGYAWDLEEIQYDMASSRTLSATLVIERE